MSPTKNAFAVLHENDIASAPLLGVELITRERNRQIVTERWSTQHDDSHTDQSMAIVAAMYAVHGTDSEVLNRAGDGEVTDAWPKTWAERFDKRNKHPRIRQLAIAGALIAAEIDRLQRAAIANAEDAEEQALPCPFCSKSAEIENDIVDNMWTVGCVNATCTVSPSVNAGNREQAVQLWNAGRKA